MKAEPRGWLMGWLCDEKEEWGTTAGVLNCGARGHLRVPWTARRSNQSILKAINPEYSLEGLMLKLRFQSFGHLMQRADLLEKTLMVQKSRGQQRMR